MASRAAEAGRKARKEREKRRRASDPHRRNLRLAIGMGAVVVLLGALVLAARNAPEPLECPDHWHATFRVFVDDRQVAFTHPSFTQPADHDYHLHADDGILHYHPVGGRCIPTEDMMARLGILPADSRLELTAVHGDSAATHEEGEGRVVAFHHQPYGQAWREVSWEDIRRIQLGNGDKLLIHAGTGEAAAIEAQKAQVPDLPPQYAP